MQNFVTTLNLNPCEFLWHDYNGLHFSCFWKRAFKIVFLSFYENLSWKFVCNERTEKLFFSMEWIFFWKSIYVYLGYKRWKKRIAMNTWNIQLCCWQSVTSRKRNNSTKTLCFCSILRSVYSSFYHSSYKNIFC